MEEIELVGSMFDKSRMPPKALQTLARALVPHRRSEEGFQLHIKEVSSHMVPGVRLVRPDDKGLRLTLRDDGESAGLICTLRCDAVRDWRQMFQIISLALAEQERLRNRPGGALRSAPPASVPQPSAELPLARVKAIMESVSIYERKFRALERKRKKLKANLAAVENEMARIRALLTEDELKGIEALLSKIDEGEKR